MSDTEDARRYAAAWLKGYAAGRRDQQKEDVKAIEEAMREFWTTP